MHDLPSGCPPSGMYATPPVCSVLGVVLLLVCVGILEQSVFTPSGLDFYFYFKCIVWHSAEQVSIQVTCGIQGLI